MIDMERGARTSGSRFAYLLGDIVRLHLATRAVRPGQARRQGLHAGHDAGARARGGARRHRLLPGRPRAGLRDRQRRPELFLVGTSEVSLAALHMGEILRRGRPAAPLLRPLVVLPARGRRGRQGHARHLPHAPVRQGRDVLVLPSRPLLGGARAPALDRARDRRRARPALPRHEHRGGRSRRAGRQEVRHRGLAAGPGPLSRAHVLLEHDRLPGAPPRRPLPQREGRAPPAHAQRHRHHVVAHAHRRARDAPARATAP